MVRDKSNASTELRPVAGALHPLAPARLAVGLIVLAATVAVQPMHAAQPPGAAAAELAASGKLDAALTLLDGWVAEHPGDERLFPLVLGVVTAAPERTTVDAVLRRYREALPVHQVGVLRAVPADFAELRGGVEQALEELRLSRLPDAGQRRAVLLLELGQLVPEAAPGGVPIALHAGLARSSEMLDDASLEASLRTVFSTPGHGDGGAGGAVAGYGLVALLAGRGRHADANSVLAELRRRYPRSPEYALAAAELRSGTTPPSVVSLPSPTMLLRSAALACRSPCTIPALAPPGTASRESLATVLGETLGETGTPPSASPGRDHGAPLAELATALEQIESDAPAMNVAEPATTQAAGDHSHGGYATAPSWSESGAQRSLPVHRSSSTSVARSDRADSNGITLVTVTGSERQPTGGQAVLPRPAPAAAAATVPARRSQPASHGEANGSATVTAVPPTAATGRPATGHGSTVRVSTVRVVSSPGSPSDRIDTPVAVAPKPRVRVSAEPAARQTPSGGVTVSAQPQSPRVASGSAASVAVAPDPASGRGVKSGSTKPVRVVSLPDPAAFVVQVGAYVDPDNALAIERKLRDAGFPAVARSYRKGDGSIVHRVAVGANVTRAKAEQMLTRLANADFLGTISRRDVASYLPPPPRRR